MDYSKDNQCITVKENKVDYIHSGGRSRNVVEDSDRVLSIQAWLYLPSTKMACMKRGCLYVSLCLLIIKTSNFRWGIPNIFLGKFTFT